MLTALSEKKITEGHTRPLLMLVEKPEEQETLFKEIVFRKITVREAEAIARRIAVERARNKSTAANDPEIREIENKFNQALGTRVMIEKKDNGGKVVINFFTNDDLRHILELIEAKGGAAALSGIATAASIADSTLDTSVIPEGAPIDDSTPADAKEDEDLYSIKNFSL
jgi:hypothetical protein